MKYKSGKQFIAEPQKNVLLMGLSGVGKTTACRMLPSAEWFHYSVDYRIWTQYLGNKLDDYLKSLALEQPVLKELLKKDAISIENRIHFDNLFSTSVYMGMLGAKEAGGSDLDSFVARMNEYSGAEISAMLDIPYFMDRSKKLYGYPHFLVDASGSLCEVIDLDNADDEVMKLIKKECLVIYIEATKEHEAELIRRNRSDPKPIYYRQDFIEQNLPDLLDHFDADSTESIDPQDVGRFLYPRLLEHRIPRYKTIADNYGYTISMSDVLKISSPDNLLGLIAKAIDDSTAQP